MMMDFLKRLFRKRRLHRIDGGLTDLMQAKDPELFERIRFEPVGSGWRIWKEVHPEDFPDGGLTVVGPRAIKATTREMNDRFREIMAEVALGR